MESSHRSYTYTALPSSTHIRTLVLQPSVDQNSPLHCRVQEISLDRSHAEPYEAISYTWGAPVFSHVLYSSDGTIFHITANLHAALQRFRSPYHVRRLWADAVCINQRDPLEKAVQINLMHRVFRCANKVLVWLGEGEMEMEAVNILWRVSQEARVANSEDGEGSTPLVTREDAVTIGRLLQMPWFSRRWIIQEVVLNSDVVIFCASVEISWTRLFHAINILSYHGLLRHVDRSVVGSLQVIHKLWQRWSLGIYGSTQLDLLSLLNTFDRFECVDDRDRLYALSALAERPRRQEAYDVRRLGRLVDVVDYSASVEEVYIAFAARALCSDPYKLLSLATTHGQDDANRTLPSWVPDWRQRSRASVPPLFHNRLQPIQIETLEISQGVLHLGLPLMSIQYIYVSTVTTAYDLTSFDPHATMQWILKSAHHFARFGYPSPRRPRDGDSLSVICDLISNRFPNINLSWLRWNAGDKDSLATKNRPALKLVHHVMAERCLLIAHGGYDMCAGIGSANVKKGDVGIKFETSDFGERPYGCILRPVPAPAASRFPSYTLVGEACFGFGTPVPERNFERTNIDQKILRIV
ncbi:heterokaryon incompatibility protein-domain-containing protein [Aspergillus coremiiformis]|uniref:Heterokaryon incompatibility protein-domain-containing protein n=1 Tax=Aspergillus coremiiformis TaxID=138285 RepID=A0A5N6ZCE4_9EURO|nr:heterokaryon incompatibility protein-domain-containing protein [Aspergillus coremiiformis]